MHLPWCNLWLCNMMLGGIGGKKRRGRQKMRWLDGITESMDMNESEWIPRVGDGQGGLMCCDSWGRKELDTTERLIWSDLMGIESVYICMCMYVCVCMYKYTQIQRHTVTFYIRMKFWCALMNIFTQYWILDEPKINNMWTSVMLYMGLTLIKAGLRV